MPGMRGGILTAISQVQESGKYTQEEVELSNIEETWTWSAMGNLEEGRCPEISRSGSISYGGHWDAAEYPASVRGRHAYSESRTDPAESKQHNAHKAMTKTIGAQQLELKRGLGDQRDTMKSICLDTGRIRDTQASLAQSMSTQHTEVRDHLHSQARDLESAFASQKSTTAPIGIDVQNANSQIQVIMALQKSLVEFVSVTYLIYETRSYISDLVLEPRRLSRSSNSRCCLRELLKGVT